MRTYFSLFFGALLAISATQGVAAETPAISLEGIHLSQNTGAADRTMGNSSMGLGEGIQRLPDQNEGAPVQTQVPPPRQRYEEGGHGDNDTDMEHRPRRTLGDQEKEKD